MIPKISEDTNSYVKSQIIYNVLDNNMLYEILKDDWWRLHRILTGVSWDEIKKYTREAMVCHNESKLYRTISV